MQNSQPHGTQNESRNRSSQNSLIAASKKIASDKNKIKSNWEQKVREKVSFADNQTSLALQNTLQIFLDQLSESLEQAAMTAQYDIGEKGMSKQHGESRAKFAGYFLPQLLKEFSILRQVLLENLNDSDFLTFEVGQIINITIDQAISLAATEFADVQKASIESALQKSEESNEDLDHFAAVAAHDLKSPLATISGYLEMLEMEAKNKASKEFLSYINVMQKATERMGNLVDRLLDYARLGKTKKPFELVDLNDVMESATQNLHDTIEKTQTKITFKNLPTVKGDVTLLVQVFQNLIANSIKFRSANQPVIQIDATLQNENFLISLKDNGIGFDPKDKEGIFGLYKKLHAESKYQGAGIGLATCRKVVELHGGKIWADSKPNLGSTFYFTLPNSTQTPTPSHH